MCSVKPRWLTGWTCGGTRAVHRVTPHFAEEKSTLTETFAPLHIYSLAVLPRDVWNGGEWECFFFLFAFICLICSRSLFSFLFVLPVFSLTPQTILSVLSSPCLLCSAGDNSWLWVSTPPVCFIPHVCFTHNIHARYRHNRMHTGP